MKKLQIVLGLFVCAFMVIPFMGVKAINVDNIGGNVTSEQKDNVWYLTLKGNDKQDIEIREDETVILDLNGFNLTNYTDGCSTIWVQNGGTLTIVDSKGTGTIKKLNASAAPTIKNDGTLKIGMSASCTIILEEAENALTILLEALQTDDEQNNYVTVINDNGTSTKQEVEIGIQNDAYVQIVSGLSEENKIEVQETSTDNSNSFNNFMPGDGMGRQNMGDGNPPERIGETPGFNDK